MTFEECRRAVHDDLVAHEFQLCNLEGLVSELEAKMKSLERKSSQIKQDLIGHMEQLLSIQARLLREDAESRGVS